MDDHYITLGELAALVGIFVGPFLLAGGVTQFLLLHRAGVRPWLLSVVLTASAVLTLLLTWALMYVVPRVDVFGYGGSFLGPGLLAAVSVSVCIAILARLRQPAA
jgi:uncharacterized membrane protein